jgi:Na+-driven multidrug efflux pump
VALGSGVIGLLVAAWPQAWVWMFTDDPAVAAIAAQALRSIGPAYAALGLGMALYFASQGAGRMGRPFVAALLRVGCAAGGGALAGYAGWGLGGVFDAVALGLVVYAVVMGSGVRRGLWRPSS